MNILRTIPKREKPQWVRLFFQSGPHAEAPAPAYPPSFPLSRRLKHPVEGCFLYVVYRSEIVGYGRIAEVVAHEGFSVGTDRHAIAPGDRIVLAGPLNQLPFKLGCQGFRNFRYTEHNLHELDLTTAEEAIRALKLDGR